MTERGHVDLPEMAWPVVAHLDTVVENYCVRSFQRWHYARHGDAMHPYCLLNVIDSVFRWPRPNSNWWLSMLFRSLLF